MRASRRGFTLIELLVVVAMIGVLAALALVGYRKYMNSAHSSEAQAVIQGIRAGEESYKAETLTYVGCSGCGAAGCAPGAGSLTTYYPQTTGTPNSSRWNWLQSGHPDYNCWRLLNVTTDGPVRFGYAVVAGLPGQQMPAATSFTTNPPIWPNPTTNPWYVVQSQGDPDGQGVSYLFISSSLSAEIYSEQH